LKIGKFAGKLKLPLRAESSHRRTIFFSGLSEGIKRPENFLQVI
jgi:hypothetical protein